MATAPLRKCTSGVAGTPVIDSPMARVATSSVPSVTLTKTAFRWYFSIARLAAADTFSASGPCLGVEPCLATVVPLVEPPEGSPEPEALPLARSFPPPQPARAKDAVAAPAPINFSACLRDIVSSASLLADVARGELAVGASLPEGDTEEVLLWCVHCALALSL